MATSNKRKAGLAGAALVAALGLVTAWEGREQTAVQTPDGKRYEAYQDIVGVWTACDGVTKGIKPNDTFTEAQCDASLAVELQRSNDYVNRCVVTPLSDKERGAYVSAGYNLGPAVVCGWSEAQYVANGNKLQNCRRYELDGVRRCASEVQYKLNSRDRVGACNALLSWNKAGGKVVKGLTNRRQDEVKTCLEGAASWGG